jgi:hypothetical protein
VALIAVSHKPITGAARQFDGSLESLIDILSGRPKTNVTATLTFNENGDFCGLQLSGPELGNGFQLALGDWVVFPTDTNESPFGLPSATAGDNWQVVQ